MHDSEIRGRFQAVVATGTALALLFGAACDSNQEKGSVASTTVTQREGEKIPGGSPATESPTPADHDLIGRFLNFANRPDEEHAIRLPFVPQVKLGLGQDFHVSTSSSDLARADSWRINVEYFRAYSGPFSALETARDAPETVVSVGGHTRCASPPEPAPAGSEHLRRVSVEPNPRTYDSCLKWWSVDLFVNADGKIEAVTLDAYEP